MSPTHRRVHNEKRPPQYTVDVEFGLAPDSLRGRILLGAVAAAMAGGVVVSTVLGIVGPPTHLPPTSAPISGALALRPDLMRAARWPFADNGGFAAEEVDSVASSEPSIPLPPTLPPSVNPAAGSVRGTVETAREFFRRLDAAPAEALALIDPALLGGQTPEFVSAWTQARSVALLHVEPLRDGSLRADVLVSYAEGDAVLLRLVFRVSPGHLPKIHDATLTTARHQIATTSSQQPKR